METEIFEFNILRYQKYDWLITLLESLNIRKKQILLSVFATVLDIRAKLDIWLR
jgi:hypothetical protein